MFQKILSSTTLKRSFSSSHYFPSSISNSLLYGIIGVNTFVFYLWHRADGNYYELKKMKKHFTVSKSGVFDMKRIYTLFTATFSHQSLNHYLGNMITLYFFGSTALPILGPLKFSLLYFGGGILSSFGQILTDYYSQNSRLYYQKDKCHLGASGGVMSVLTWTILSFPRSMVLVYFIIPVPAALLGVLYLANDIYGMVGGYEGVSYAGHLVGTAYGAGMFLFLKYRHRLLRRW